MIDYFEKNHKSSNHQFKHYIIQFKPKKKNLNDFFHKKLYYKKIVNIHFSMVDKTDIAKIDLYF